MLVLHMHTTTIASPLTSKRARQNLLTALADLEPGLTRDCNHLSPRRRYWQSICALVGEPLNNIPFGLHCDNSAVESVLEKERSARLRHRINSEAEVLNVRVPAALAAVRAFSEDFVNVFDEIGLSVHFFTRNILGARSGSDFRLPGFFFVSADESENPVDIGESIVHELVHNWLFFEEMANGLFEDRIFLEPEETCTVSPMRNGARRFDQAFHGLFVSVMLTAYRKSLHMRQRNAMALIEASFVAIESMVLDSARLERPVLGSRGVKLFEELKEFWKVVRMQLTTSQGFIGSP